ncbi:HAD family hydrolase [Paenibacillus nasutitermitis]|uniref:Haloacid dehalogenase n=1 Tax=Paenibacillus nasutitermitis TaxID=1652958 RepID=A0A917DPV1_9BACL|nr:HAD family hydrolase [Paenibacillus nasutitermitis]GGD55259.1 haloacid dehalogenase [Paenibacillus nasutitermitis]
MIRAVVFDFDGLIIDTETPSYHAFCEVYREYGAELPFEMYAKCVGTTFEHFDPHLYLSECVGEAIDPKLVNTRFRAVYSRLMSESALRPGVVEYLQTARKLQIKTAIATSASLSWVEPYLQRFELKDYFDHITTADDVSKVKPDPELYLQSLSKLGVAAEEAISFEDSLNGFKAARAAGLNCVVVPNEMTKQFAFADYDLMMDSMADRSLEEVIHLLSRVNESNRSGT